MPKVGEKFRFSEERVQLTPPGLSEAVISTILRAARQEFIGHQEMVVNEEGVAAGE